jgi:hypothetical protein
VHREVMATLEIDDVCQAIKTILAAFAVEVDL